MPVPEPSSTSRACQRRTHVVHLQNHSSDSILGPMNQVLSFAIPPSGMERSVTSSWRNGLLDAQLGQETTCKLPRHFNLRSPTSFPNPNVAASPALSPRKSTRCSSWTISCTEASSSYAGSGDGARLTHPPTLGTWRVCGRTNPLGTPCQWQRGREAREARPNSPAILWKVHEGNTGVPHCQKVI